MCHIEHVEGTGSTHEASHVCATRYTSHDMYRRVYSLQLLVPHVITCTVHVHIPVPNESL